MLRELKVYTPKTIRPLLGNRVGEELLGTKLHFVESAENLGEHLAGIDADCVLFGIEEDIGVRANHGRPGTSRAWHSALQRLVNVQLNPDNNFADAVLLGHLDFSGLESEIRKTNGLPADLGPFVECVDAVVSQLVEIIVRAGKVPIAIGGGHNNAFALLKGSSGALGRGLNALNVDAHADLRPADYRHSGNGFTYALNADYLDRYFVFGLHENYNSQAIYREITGRNGRVAYCSYEAMRVRGEADFETEAAEALEFVGGGDYGLELDLDCIENIPSSALTPSGWSVREIRRLAHLFASWERLRYVHICEAAPGDAGGPDEIIVGKLIAYLVTDILKVRNTVRKG